MTNDLKEKWHNGLLEIASAVKESGFVIYGTSEYGELAYDIFQLWDIKPLCFADDSDIYGRKFQPSVRDISVVSIEEAASLYPEAVFIRADDHQYLKIKGLANIVDLKNDNLNKLGVCGKYSRFQVMRYKFLADYAKEKGIKSFQEMKEQLGEITLRQDSFARDNMDSVIFHSPVNVSGSFMFAQLCDGHPQIINLPLILDYKERLEIGLAQVYRKRLCNLTGLELTIETMAQILFLVKGYQEIDWFLDADGNSVSEGIQLPAASFFNELYLQMRDNAAMSFGDIFKAIHCAYANASGKQRKPGLKYYIFYHMHARGFRGLYWKEFFKEVYCIDTVREPFRSAFSTLKGQLPIINRGDFVGKGAVDNAILYDSVYWLNKDQDGFYHHIRFVDGGDGKDFCIDVPTELHVDASVDAKIDYLVNTTLASARLAHIYFVRFEDLKLRLEETMRSVCKRLQIEFDPVMLETTANGNKIFESTQYLSSAGGKASFDQKDLRSFQPVDYAEYMNDYDMERIRIIYKRVTKYFDYGEYTGKDVSELSDAEKEELLNRPCKMQTDCCPDNKGFTPFLVALNMASSAVAAAVAEELQKQGKEYLIKPGT